MARWLPDGPQTTGCQATNGPSGGCWWGQAQATARQQAGARLSLVSRDPLVRQASPQTTGGFGWSKGSRTVAGSPGRRRRAPRVQVRTTAVPGAAQCADALPALHTLTLLDADGREVGVAGPVPLPWAISIMLPYAPAPAGFFDLAAVGGLDRLTDRARESRGRW